MYALQWYECLLVDLPRESLNVCTACIRRCNAQGCVDGFIDVCVWTVCVCVDGFMGHNIYTNSLFRKKAQL